MLRARHPIAVGKYRLSKTRRISRPSIKRLDSFRIVSGPPLARARSRANPSYYLGRGRRLLKHRRQHLRVCRFSAENRRLQHARYAEKERSSAAVDRAR